VESENEIEGERWDERRRGQKRGSTNMDERDSREETGHGVGARRGAKKKGGKVCANKRLPRSSIKTILLTKRRNRKRKGGTEARRARAERGGTERLQGDHGKITDLRSINLLRGKEGLTGDRTARKI